ncbi:hypothetical protein ACIBBD_01940 [Streptomyces sp. NPDC051315]|uniref:hypothetical protein n=1 Tax=Streptomyces sp. NPDC051315 TaxID=3365650 RepID=UPI0037995043
MTKSSLGTHRDLAWALKQQAKRTGERTRSVRGSDWQMATVTVVNADGTVDTADIPAIRCMETYLQPTAGDLIYITQESSGNWLAWGRGSTGGFTLGSTVVARKTANTSRASTTAIAADPHLSINVVAGTYQVQALILYDADTTGDLKLGWFAPASTTGAWWPGGSDASNTTFAATARWGALTDFSVSTLPVAGVGTGNVVACIPTGTAVVTGTGQITLAWAQNSSSATATVVRQHSWLQLRRIA